MVCWGNNTDRSFLETQRTLSLRTSACSKHPLPAHIVLYAGRLHPQLPLECVQTLSQQRICTCGAERSLTASSVNWPSGWNRKICRITNLSSCWELSIQVLYLLLQLFYLILVLFLLPIQFLIMCFALSLWNRKMGATTVKTHGESHRNTEVFVSTDWLQTVAAQLSHSEAQSVVYCTQQVPLTHAVDWLWL